MARGSRPARAARHGSMHNTKRTMTKGNNRFGSKGCLKCEECRRRKTRCEFDESNPNDPCRDCRKRGFPCGKALPAQTNGGSDYTHSLTSTPSPSDSSSPVPCPPFTDPVNLEIEVKPMTSEGTLLSVTMQMESMMKDARQLQIAFPKWSGMDIIDKIRERIERGEYGNEMCSLIYPSPQSRPSVNQSANIFVPVSQPAENGCRMYSHSASYSQHGTPHGFFNANYINPSTLESGFTYTAQFHGEDGYLESMHPEAEFETPYNYVSVMGVVPDLIVQDTHDASVTGPYHLGYGLGSREIFSSLGTY